MIMLPIVTLIPKKIPVSIILLFLFFAFFKIQLKKDKTLHNIFNVTYSSEGLLGQVKVVDFSINMKSFGSLNPRGLLVNNTWQTLINKNDEVSLLDYVYFITPIIKTYSDQTIDNLSKFLIEKSQIDLKNAIVLTDDKPVLEILLMRPALEWRQKLNEIFRDRLVKDKQPIYY